MTMVMNFFKEPVDHIQIQPFADEHDQKQHQRPLTRDAARVFFSIW